jgi:hypothetical protein
VLSSRGESVAWWTPKPGKEAMTAATQQALDNLRDASHLHWCVVALLAIAVYIYAVEIERSNWNLAIFGFGRGWS